MFLSIHYYFPPIKSGGVVRNYHIASSLSRIYKKGFVVTTSNSEVLEKEEIPIPQNVEIHISSTLDFRSFKRNKKSGHRSEKKKKGRFTQFLIKLQKSFPFNIFIGEGGLIYIISAYRKGQGIIRNNNIELIYSSAFPYADHIVGALLKRKNRDVKWVADFRDLQVEPIYKNVFFPRFQRWCERRILKRADLITSVSQGLTDQLATYGRPVHKMLRGIEPRPEAKLYDKFTIAYTGSLYKHYRNPQLLFRVLHDLLQKNLIHKNNFSFLYAGRDGRQMKEWATQYGVETIFKDLGMVTRKQSLELQSKAHINLLLTSSSPELKGVLTGKLFEYLEAGRYIVSLIDGVKDEEMENLFAELNAGNIFYNVSSEQQKLSDLISDMSFHWEKDRSYLFRMNIDNINEGMKWENRVRKMLEKIE